MLMVKNDTYLPSTVPLASFGDTELETQLHLSHEAATRLEKERDEACEAERKIAAELQSKL
jgi:hypothetical protein